MYKLDKLWGNQDTIYNHEFNLTTGCNICDENHPYLDQNIVVEDQRSKVDL